MEIASAVNHSSVWFVAHLRMLSVTPSRVDFLYYTYITCFAAILGDNFIMTDICMSLIYVLFKNITNKYTPRTCYIHDYIYITLRFYKCQPIYLYTFLSC